MGWIVLPTAQLLVLFHAVAASATVPSSDDIPVIGQRFAPWCWSPLLLCRLAWSHFDGFETQLGAGEGSTWADLLETAGDLDLLVIITPTESYELSHLGTGSRAHLGALDSADAFFETDELGSTVERELTATQMQDEIELLAESLVLDYSDFDALWCWKLMDEAPTAQRSRMFDSSY
jgi:hypothetical protein